MFLYIYIIITHSPAKLICIYNFCESQFPPNSTKFKSLIFLFYFSLIPWIPNSMADFTAPSFSLGLDLAFDSDLPAPTHQNPSHSPPNPPPPPAPNHDSDPQVPDSDPESGPDPPRRLLKRLRRGPPPPQSCFDGDDDIEEFSSQDDGVVQGAWNHSVCSSSKVSLNGCGVLKPNPSSNCKEKRRKQATDVPTSVRMETGQSGLVFPKLTTTPLRRFQLCDSDSDDPVGEDVSADHKIDPCSKEEIHNQCKPVTSFEQNGSSRMETGQSGPMFPKLTTSPLRRFQLLDSDSDDPVGQDVSAAHKNDPRSNDAKCNRRKPVDSFENKRKTSFDMKQDRDLWNDFSPVKSFSIPTPAFNEVCEEYFRSAKYKEVEVSGIDISEGHNERYFGVNPSCQRDQQLWESAGPLPPAHLYFFHEDPKIQRLVRNRLSNFSPLGVNRVNQQPNVPHIDYMGQFGNEGASKAQGAQKAYVNSSTSGKNKSKNLTVGETFDASGGRVDPKIVSTFSNGESSRKKATKRNNTKNRVSKGKNKADKSTSSNVSYASANWVEPKSCANMPKDAGKRRVQASSQSSGHWFTSSDGRKVYVNKSGQELTGRNAYRQYRKESGAGFKKSKGKTSAKKTSAKKTNAKKRN